MSKSLFDKPVDGGVNSPQFAMVVLLRLTACSVPASQFSMVAPHRSQAHSRLSLLHWAHRRLLQPLAAPPLSPSLGLLRPVSRTARGLRAPHQFPLKSYGFSGAETARKRFLLWKMGFSAAAYCEPLHPSIQHGRPTALAGSLAALPASLGLLRAVSPTGRALRAPPPYTPPGTIEMQKGFALLRALTKYRKNEA